MSQSISAVALVVNDYDEAVHFFTRCLRFTVVEDTPLPEGKRWVTVRPPGGGTALLLAKVATPDQAARVGDQTGGRVFLFLQTDDCQKTYGEFSSRGVEFQEAPEQRPYGIDAGFRDPSGNNFRLTEVTPMP